MIGVFQNPFEKLILIAGRLSRLEQTVSALVERLDGGVQLQRQDAGSSNTPPDNPHRDYSPAPGSPSAAPVLLIRDVASEVGVRQQQSANSLPRDSRASSDIISKGLISFLEASNLISLLVPRSIDILF